jgi:hypothetical protein
MTGDEQTGQDDETGSHDGDISKENGRPCSSARTDTPFIRPFPLTCPST